MTSFLPGNSGGREATPGKDHLSAEILHNKQTIKNTNAAVFRLCDFLTLFFLFQSEFEGPGGRGRGGQDRMLYCGERNLPL